MAVDLLDELVPISEGGLAVNSAFVNYATTPFSTCAAARAATIVTANCILTAGKRWKWNATSTATDDETESTTAIQHTGTTTGRYLPVQSNPSLLATVNGLSVAVSELNVTGATAEDGVLSFDATSGSSLPGYTGLMAQQPARLCLPCTLAGSTHLIDTGVNVKQWTSKIDGLNLTQPVEALMPSRGIVLDNVGLVCTAAAGECLAGSSPIAAAGGQAAWTRIVAFEVDTAGGAQTIVDNVGEADTFKITCTGSSCTVALDSATVTIGLTTGADVVRALTLVYDGTEAAADRLKIYKDFDVTAATPITTTGTVPTTLPGATIDTVGSSDSTLILLADYPRVLGGADLAAVNTACKLAVTNYGATDLDEVEELVAGLLSIFPDIHELVYAGDCTLTGSDVDAWVARIGSDLSLVSGKRQIVTEGGRPSATTTDITTSTRSYTSAIATVAKSAWAVCGIPTLPFASHVKCVSTPSDQALIRGNYTTSNLTGVLDATFWVNGAETASVSGVTGLTILETDASGATATGCLVGGYPSAGVAPHNWAAPISLVFLRPSATTSSEQRTAALALLRAFFGISAP